MMIVELKDTKVFSLEEQGDEQGGKRYRVRYYVRKNRGMGPNGLTYISFNTPYYLPSKDQWDIALNRVKQGAPDAERINTDLNRISEMVHEAIMEGMNEKEIRDLMGVPRTRPAPTTRKPRRDKGAMRVATAKQTLVEAGYTHRITPRRETEEPGPAPELHPDPETNSLLQRFGSRPVTPLSRADLADPSAQLPEPAPQLQVMPAQDYYVVVDEQQVASDTHFMQTRMGEEQAQRYATAQALSTQRPQFVFHCKPVARVQVAVQIDQL